MTLEKGIKNTPTNCVFFAGMPDKIKFLCLNLVLIFSTFILIASAYCAPGKRTYTRADIEREKEVPKQEIIPAQDRKNELCEYREKMKEIREQEKNNPDRIPVSEERIIETKQRMRDELGLDIPIVED